jgi:hypothetical protein
MKRANALLVATFLLVAAMVLGVDAARAEVFVDLYVGGAFTADTNGTFGVGVPPDSIPELPEPFDDATDIDVAFGIDVDLDNSVSGGARAGYWLDSTPWLGFALDGSYFRAAEGSEPGIPSTFKLKVIPVSGLLMLRHPILKSREFPRGQVYVYGAGGPAAFVSMATVDGLDFDDTDVSIGLDARVGVKLFHAVQSWGAFAEYRFTYFGPSQFEDDIEGVRFKLRYDELMTHHLIIGLAYHF